MIFIIRARPGPVPPRDVKLVRQTPSIVPDRAGQIDYVCAGDPDAARAAGWTVVSMHDGWYADDTGGGIAVWGQGTYWEIRDTPFTVQQFSGPVAPAAKPDPTPEVNVRQAIFQG